MLTSRVRTAAKAKGLRIIDDRSHELQSWLDDSGVNAALVRPDRYVAGTACSEDNLMALMVALKPRSTTPGLPT